MSAKTQKLVQKLAEIEKQVNWKLYDKKKCLQLKKEGIYIPEPEQEYGAVTKQVLIRFWNLDVLKLIQTVNFRETN